MCSRLQEHSLGPPPFYLTYLPSELLRAGYHLHYTVKETLVW